MIDQSDIDDRIAKCTKILEDNPNSQIFAALADAHRKRGDLDRAFRVCQNGLKVHPGYGSGHLVMAKINMDRGMYDWAESEINKATELDGVTRTTELLLSEVFIYKGEFNKACRILEKLLRSDPDNEQIRKLLDIARKIPLETRPGNALSPVSGPSQDAGVSTPAEPPSLPKLNDKQQLRALVVVPGVEGALLVNKDGLVLEAEWNDQGDTDLTGALAAETARYCAVQMRESGFGTVQSVLIETGRSFLYLSNAGGRLLAVVCTESINLGTLKLKLASLLGRVTG
ncbi:MAG: roadblock/LC7 domain-containing protein [candidate division Zixibacteria bacterium]|nr:roadblock/LC7 domain-containing protein [candidate division Zixibacteria bacterium]